MARKDDIVFIKNGKRLDGRGLSDMRPIKMQVGLLDRADGSALVEVGNTRALAAVFGPGRLHPQHLQDPKRAVLRVRYNMAPFSVTERSRPGPNRRSKEISLVTRKALESLLFLEEFPGTGIEVYIEILEANASTRVTGITAAALALADAGIPMYGLISACSVGTIDGQIILDVAGEEDSYGSSDIPVATINGSDEITLLQLDGDVSKKELHEALKLAVKGCAQLYKLQEKALKEHYGISGTVTYKEDPGRGERGEEKEKKAAKRSRAKKTTKKEKETKNEPKKSKTTGKKVK